MALFGVLVENTEKVRVFIEEVKENFKNTNYIKNPFTADIKKFIVTDRNNTVKNLYVFSIIPIYFNFSIFGWLFCIGILFWRGLSFLLIPGVLVGSLGAFYSSHFYYLMFRYALKKKGYKGSAKMVGPKEIVNELHFRRF